MSYYAIMHIIYICPDKKHVYLRPPPHPHPLRFPRPRQTKKNSDVMKALDDSQENHRKKITYITYYSHIEHHDVLHIHFVVCRHVLPAK